MRQPLRQSSSRALLAAFAAALVFCTAISLPHAALAEARPSVDQQVREAMASFRGIDLSGLSKDQRKAVYDKLDGKWDFLMKHRKESGKIAREVLDAADRDSFQTIELAYFLLVLDQDLEDPAEYRRWLSSVRPAVYPSGFWRLTSAMASKQCTGCLPVVMKMLELPELEDVIPQHAMDVDIQTGLLFTVVQYGDSAVDPTVQSLDSDSCVVRSNAAFVLGYLLPNGVDARIRKMALEDECTRARASAWSTLATLDGPLMIREAKKRASSGTPIPQKEVTGMLAGLSDTGVEDALPVFDALAGKLEGADAKIAAGLRKELVAMSGARAGKPSGRSYKRSHAKRLLEKAAKTGILDFDGDVLQLLDALQPGDLPLLNRARASVLRRLSDECLYEYMPMTYAAIRLRRDAGGGSAPGH